MSYLGVPPFGQTIRTITELTATAGQTTFTPSGGYLPGYIDVFLNGVSLDSSDFTASNGSTVVLTSAAALDDEIKTIAYWPVSLTDTYRKGEVDAGFVGKDSATGAALMPVGTTAQRPVTPTSGMFRMNSTTGNPEWYDTSTGAWVYFSQGAPYAIDYLVVAGGGAGDGGGGGAGGYVAASLNINSGDTYSVVVGAGGANVNANNAANSGSNSSILGGTISTITAVGGGRAGYTAAGTSGGSGGGGGYSGYSGGNGTSGQGYGGGVGGSTAGGGGGGANAAGQNASGSSGGTGGGGKQWLNSSYYAGGGGGGGSGASGSGGIGGGGAGASAVGTAGTANTGGGGGGVYQSYPAGSGGSGIVIIRYLGTQRGTGGTVTSAGGYTYHTFTTSGTFTA